MRFRGILLSAMLLAGSPALAGIEFVRPPTTSVSVWPKFFAVTDFNKDGPVDLAVCAPKSKEVNALLGDPAGTFAPGTVTRLGLLLNGIAAGDLSGDGIPDLAVADQRARGVHVIIRREDGTFATPFLVKVGRGPFGVAIADFDQKNGNDLAVSDRSGNRVFILVNNGRQTPGFTNAGDYEVGKRPEDIIAADFNGDNFPDIVTLNQGGRRVKDVTMLLFDRISSAFPVFTRLANFGVGARPSKLTVGDFNNDGIRDLAMLNRPINRYVNLKYINGEVNFLIGRGDGFLDLVNTLPINCPFFTAGFACPTRALSAGDFDGDGTVDLGVTQVDPRQPTVRSVMAVYVGVGDGLFVPGPISVADPSPDAMAAADFSGDGLPDIVVGSSQLSRLQIYVNVSTAPTDRKPPGQACDNADQCLSNLCTDGVCCQTECLEGELCNIPGSEGTCTPLEDNRPLGFPCDEAQPDQCLSGFCVNSTCCVVGTCPSGARCDLPGNDGTCGPLLDNGSQCDLAEHCRNGRCVDGFCCDSNCPDGRCDIPGKEGTCTAFQGLGQECRDDGQCADPGICDAVGQICCSELCNADEECAIDGNGCIANPNPTFTPGVIGGPCSRDSDCIDAQAPYCTDGVCCVTDHCDGGQVCAAGEGTCATPTPTPSVTPTRTPVDLVCPDGGPPDPATGFCSVTSRSGGGCSMAEKNGGTAADLLLACLLPAALWLGRRWQVRQVRLRLGSRRY